MQVKDLIGTLEKMIKQDEDTLKTRKENINSNYELAKLDFLVIDNLTDSISTYKKALCEVQKLQQRIIDRNTK